MAAGTCACGREYQGEDALVGHTFSCAACDRTVTFEREAPRALWPTFNCVCGSPLAVFQSETQAHCGVCGQTVPVPASLSLSQVITPRSPQAPSADDGDVDRILAMMELAPAGAALQRARRRKAAGLAVAVALLMVIVAW
ncbi:MAG: hypothetical protein ABI193_01705, partial [Minicystis sp.]